jgi:glutamate racemase
MVMAERSEAAIGVFDSGVGGLSVLRHLRALLPTEHFFYVADSGYAPYGIRSTVYIQQRAFAVADFLVARGVKALVVACNTATAAAVDALRARYPIPVVAMEPGVKPAVAATRRQVVGVLATAGTLESARFYALVSRYAGSVKILTQPCPGLVERIEAGDLDGADTRALLESYLAPLLEAGADVIVLGCTHYPLVRAAIAGLVGADIAIVDTGPAVARELQRRLGAAQLLRADGAGGEAFWTSGELEAGRAVLRRLWSETAAVERFSEPPGGL